MNQKEKAIEIYLKMLNETFAHNDKSECEHTAKQCAFILVDEILKDSSNTNYWQDVKQEIEKL